MFISVYRLSVGFVFLSTLLVTSSEVIDITITIASGKCSVSPRKVVITENATFTLKVNSDHVINESLSKWKYGANSISFSELYDRNLSILYKKTPSSYDKIPHVSINYKFFHTGKAASSGMSGLWRYRFCITENLCNHSPNGKCSSKINCSTDVKIVPYKGNMTAFPDPVESKPNGFFNSFSWLVFIGPFAGVVMLIQTIYIIYIQCKLRSPKTTIHRSETTETVCDNYNDRPIDISKRPPLPLPPEVINKEGPKSPLPPQKEQHIVKRTPPAPSPRPAHHQYDHTRPQPRITPRPVRYTGRTQTPPILSPKPNRRPPLPAEHHRENRDSSEDEWQYEKLQPGRKYLNA